ncbi:hypothetical protein CSPX01_02506 [Colletotrichum filicis]|nr:hypothetical protein CSPX01_02506 [Colletotrichum filicis]
MLFRKASNKGLLLDLPNHLSSDFFEKDLFSALGVVRSFWMTSSAPGRGRVHLWMLNTLHKSEHLLIVLRHSAFFGESSI